MEANRNLQIALRIGGTKQRRAGFAPLVPVGVLPGNEGDNMYVSPSITENPAFIVKHAPTYTLYMLIDRGVRPFDADASGNLCIALAISADAQMAGGRSPYDLLVEAHDKFVELYMTQGSDGRYVFKDTDNDPAPFREIVSRYPIEARHNVYYPMNPQGPVGVVCVPQEKMADFFANTQYKEFAAFKEVEVGVSCGQMVTESLSNLQIPLPPMVYKVLVNGTDSGQTVQLPDDPVRVESKSNDLYDYEEVVFTLGEVRAAAGGALVKGNSRITIDDVRGAIDCKQGRHDAMYTIVTTWDDRTDGGRQEIVSQAKQGQVKFSLGQVDVTSGIIDPEQSMQVKGAEIKGNSVRANKALAGNFRFTVKASLNKELRQIIVTIDVTERPVPQQPVHAVPAGGDRRGGGRTGGRTGGRNIPVMDDGKPVEPVYTSAPAQGNKLNIKLLVIAVVAALLVGGLAGVGTYMFLNSDKEEEAKSDSIPAESADTASKVAQLPSSGNTDVGGETPSGVSENADADAAQKAAEEASKKAAEEAARIEQVNKKAEDAAAQAVVAAQQKANAKAAEADFWDLINKPGAKFSKIEANAYYISLKKEQKWAVGWIKNYKNQPGYKEIIKKYPKDVVNSDIQELLKKKYKSLDEIIQVYDAITKMLAEKYKDKK